MPGFSPPHELPEGGAGDCALIAGRYELGMRIGQGGMGTVFRARDRESRQEVAIKQLRAEVSGYDPIGVERFAREAESLRQLNHPNIVKLLATVDEGDHHFIVMELLSGSLEDALGQARAPFGIDRVLRIALDLCDALARAHRLEIIHRDLKPSNVLVAADGTIRLTDFGVAYFAAKERISESRSVVGTLDYLSPETVVGDIVDGRTDLWAFGVLLFEMLTGLRPFAGPHPAATLYNIINTAPPDLEALRPDCPIALVDLIYRMLEKSRAQRIASARRVAVELESILVGHSRAARAPRAEGGPQQREEHFVQLNEPSTPFVGRQAEVRDLAQLLAAGKSRLISIVGAGGMGKSRLAVEAARQLTAPTGPLARTLPGFQQFDRVAIVELAPLGGAELILSAIAEAIGLRFLPNKSAKEQLFAGLRQERLLLVMDNFEHLLPAGATLVSELLQATQHVAVVVTSRERLDLTGESVLRLSGLTLPSSGAFACSSVELFEQCARRVKLDFELTPEALPAVARICHLVAGSPLGILLAASWTNVLTAQEIAQEVSTSCDSLSADLRDLPERQRSMQAVFNHSWSLLQAEERLAFSRLSVFRGGFTRGAAQEVAGAQLRTLARLVNKSLLARNPENGRYEVHELLRQYAELRLQQAPGDHELTRERYTAYYARFLAARTTSLKGPSPQVAAAEIEAELDNVRCAWSRIVETSEVLQAASGIEALDLFYRLRGLAPEGEAVFASTAQAFSRFERGSEGRRVGVVALTRQSLHVAEQWRHTESLALANRALELLDQPAHPREAAYALLVRSPALLWTGHSEEGLRDAERGLTLFRETDDVWGTALALIATARHYRERMQPERARAYYLESMALQASLTGGQMVFPSTLMGLGALLVEEGDYDEGSRLLSQSLELGQAQGDVLNTSMCLQLLANAERKRGNYVSAEAYARQSGNVSRRLFTEAALWDQLLLGDILKEQSRLEEAVVCYRAGSSGQDGVALAVANVNLGDVALVRGDYAQAKSLLLAGLAGFESLQLGWGIVVAHDSLGDLACSEGDDHSSASHFRRALDLSLQCRLMPMTLHVCAGIARLNARRGRSEWAVELLTAVSLHSATEHQTRARRVGPLLAELATSLRSNEFSEAAERGRELHGSATALATLAERAVLAGD